MLEDEVIEIISDNLFIKPGWVTLDKKLVDDLGADSLDLIQLVMTLEDTYQLDISDDDAEKIVYVRDVVDYIKNHAGEYRLVA
jgi:acyl carrier protein